MKYYFEVLKKYAVFTGRARRKEYWYFALFNLIFGFALIVIDAVISNIAGPLLTFDTGDTVPVLYFLYILAILIPSLAVTVRRLHDTGKSGWYFFLVLIPFIGSIILLVFMLEDGTRGNNGYGSDPKRNEEELFDFEKTSEAPSF